MLDRLEVLLRNRKVIIGLAIWVVLCLVFIGLAGNPEVSIPLLTVLSVPVGLSFLVLGVVLYFFPSLVARHRKKKNIMSIFALNLCLGWTFIGWVACLVWALMED